MVNLLLPLGLAAGAGHSVFYPELPSFWWWLAIGVCLLVFYFTRLAPMRLALLTGYGSYLGSDPDTTNGLCCLSTCLISIVRSFVLFLTAFALGAALGSLNITRVLSHQLTHDKDKQLAELVFDITYVNGRSGRATQLNATVVQVSWPDLKRADSISSASFVGQDIKLSWYSPPVLEAGQRWRGQVTLRRPRSFENPGGFDYAAWLLGQGIVATGYLSGIKKVSLIERNKETPIDSMRAALQKRLMQHEKLMARFFLALLIGDKSQLSSSDWQVLQSTGTIHLMAISGLHVGLVAGLGFGLGLMMVRLWYVRKGAFSPWLKRLMPAVISLVFATVYAALAGFSLPTQRALIACILVNSAIVLGVRLIPRVALAWAFLVMTLMQPLAWLQMGFWLSFAAVACLLLLFSGNLGHEPRWRSAWRMQWQLCVVMTLPLWLLGLPSSVIAPLVNIVAVPIIGLVIVPLLLLWAALSATPLGEWLMLFLNMIFEWLWWSLEWAATVMPAAQNMLWQPLKMTALNVLLLGMIAVALLLPRTQGLKGIAICALVCVVLGSQPKKPSFSLTALDVGQGLSVVMQMGESVWLYDTGAHFSERFNIGQHIVLPYLRQQGFAQLNMVVSHNDNDHAGGAAPLLEAFSISRLLHGEPLSGSAHKLASHQYEGSIAEPCIQGQSWREGEANFRVLWPLALTAAAKQQQPNYLANNNNLSCVLLIEVGGYRFLLPGDIEAPVEQALVDSGLLVDIDVLLAPHHGSKTSSSPDFLAAIKPEHIIVSAGFKNRYGHPHPEVLARYRALGATVWNTAEQGAVQIHLNENELIITGERNLNPKLWH